MSKVILADNHRGLGQKGEVYDCPNDEVADKLIRLGYAVVAETDLPCAETVPDSSDEPADPAAEVTSFEDLQAAEDEALLAACDDATDVTDLVNEDGDE